MSEQTKSVVKQTVGEYGAGGVMSILVAILTFVVNSPELRQALIDLLKKLGILNVEGQVVEAPAFEAE